MKNSLKLVISIIICQLAGLLGSIFSFSSVSDWYATIVRPELAPPNWIFGPVWTTLYILMGIALYLVWKRGLKQPQVKRAVTIFALQLALNALWSILFFGLQNPGLAFIEIILMWLAIIWTIRAFYPISRKAAYLLVPYLLWVSFATYLNGAIWFLN